MFSNLLTENVTSSKMESQAFQNDAIEMDPVSAANTLDVLKETTSAFTEKAEMFPTSTTDTMILQEVASIPESGMVTKEVTLEPKFHEETSPAGPTLERVASILSIATSLLDEDDEAPVEMATTISEDNATLHSMAEPNVEEVAMTPEMTLTSEQVEYPQSIADSILRKVSLTNSATSIFEEVASTIETVVSALDKTAPTQSTTGPIVEEVASSSELLAPALEEMAPTQSTTVYIFEEEAPTLAPLMASPTLQEVHSIQIEDTEIPVSHDSPFNQDAMEIASTTESVDRSHLEKSGLRKLVLRKSTADSQGTAPVSVRRKSARLSVAGQLYTPNSEPKKKLGRPKKQPMALEESTGSKLSTPVSQRRKLSDGSSTKQRKRSLRSSGAQDTPPLKQKKALDGQAEKVYHIEKILDYRVNAKTGREEWKVKWTGYDGRSNTWEPRESFRTTEMIEQFAAQRATASPNINERRKSSARSESRRSSSIRSIEAAAVNVTEPIMAKATTVFNIEKILDHRFNHKIGRDEWLVQWTGYGPDHNSWEPRESFTSNTIIEKFTKLQAKKESRKSTPKTSLDQAQFEMDQEAGPSTSRPLRSAKNRRSVLAPPFPHVFMPINDSALAAYDRKVTEFAENLRRELGLAAREGEIPTPKSRYFQYLRMETNWNKQELATGRSPPRSEEQDKLSNTLHEMTETALRTWHSNTTEALENDGLLEQLGLTCDSTEGEVMDALLEENVNPSENHMAIMKCISSFIEIVGNY